MQRVVLLLGGNIGDMERRITNANELIEQKIGHITLRSKMVRSAGWGFRDEVAPFTNQAVVVQCALSPEELLNATQSIEQQMGRDRECESEQKRSRGERYASRMIDIDIIFYGDLIYKSERLELPHPLMQEREFVLAPMVQIIPEWRHPSLNMSCAELLERLKNEG